MSFQYLLRRLLLMIPTFLGITLLSFVVIQAAPGGRIESYLAKARFAGGAGGDGGAGTGSVAGGNVGGQVSNKVVEELKKQYGFDKPAHVRYVQMLADYARFDLGRSFLHNKDVWTLIKEKLPVSVSLGLWTFLVSYLVSIPLGVAKAVREGSAFDTATTMLVLVGNAIPGFVLGVLLIVLFAGGTFLDWFPLRGLVSDLLYVVIDPRVQFGSVAK